MAYAAGVDVGSTQTKAVIIDENRNIISRALIDTGANVVLAAENAYKRALQGDGATEELPGSDVYAPIEAGSGRGSGSSGSRSRKGAATSTSSSPPSSAT